MLPKVNPTISLVWVLLNWHFDEEMSRCLMKVLFADADRFKKFSLRLEDILFDYSKNIITAKTQQLLLQLAEECKIKEAVESMFSGDLINETEGRSVLHTALRNFSGKPVYSEGKDVMPEVHKVQQQMKDFCAKVHSGELKGYTGKKIKYFVNIGIGGSDLGPLMVTEALKPNSVEVSQP